MKDLLTSDILTKTFDGLPTGVGIFHVPDLDDIESVRYVYMNNVILYEMRKNREEVFGKRIMEVAPEAYEHEGGLAVIETYRKVAAEGGNVDLGLVEYSNHMVAGIYECSVHFIKPHYVYVMLRNVTELEKAKNELEIKNQELSRFAYMASHDLKEPLRTISSLVQILEIKYKGKLDAESDKIIDYISQASIRLKDLIDALLDYSNIGKGKMKKEIDCNEIIEVIKEDLAVVIKETNTIINTTDLPVLLGLEAELRMLFQNLISNGIKFSKAETSPIINISASHENGWTFKVEDNGIGIDPKYKEKIFSIFERLHTKEEYEGAGIGLAHCKKVVELHNGRIWVESTPGIGSSFYFSISES
ncbi:hypothetical protein MATR_27170 [Marivirga tractuosa]|uniref:histidine kinase n=1 Tax=Marivirga tractuosa (strain ATCC 23168 / DSM 4126 / NBRC 15989 / NCIMB 1408 / VKM B-1430 / H-43) TaxID=643867 RepID=E4TMJ9_MARTH|nr:ATP-binding protein [Marivirga tractuosa]ADR23433.1 histidine kinase [Marivirga tractuosa DSM 4126]BDD15892.1 hypothetical protein MATR_27170 [Marivirga tractuosa]